MKRTTLRKALDMALFGGIALSVVLLCGCVTDGSPDWAPNEGLAFIGNIWRNGAMQDVDFIRYWNQVTPENGGKWGSVEPVRDVMRWFDLDLAYKYAKARGFPFRLHTLVWGQQQPAWIGELGEEEQLAEVAEWFSLLADRYPDIEMIDVVNEPTHETPPYKAALQGMKPSPWEWIASSFRLARTYFPSASLGLNDYNILSTAVAARSYASIVRALKEEGLIDYIGVQGHFLERTSVQTVTAALDVLAAEELPIYITEFDLNIADDQLQAERMEELITAFAANPWVRGITLWGYKEGEIWRKDAYLLRADGTERPALTWLRGFVEERFPAAR